MKIGDVYYEKHTVTEISHRTSTVSETQVERIDAIPQKWISVSERLPEYRTEVLTCSDGGFIEIQSLEDSYGGYWENKSGDWTDLDEIVAWMYLPKPYKTESEDAK